MNLAARIVLVLATAALNLVDHRGMDFVLSAALHLVATSAWLWLVWGVVRGGYRPGVAEAVGLALLLRLLVLPLGPGLSDDVYRYMHEGRMVLAGESPYLTAPADVPPELRGEYWEQINNKTIPAAYPPAVQYALAMGVLISPHPLGMKILFGLFDFLVFLALWRWLPSIGVDRERAIIHGLCPLMVLEFAGEGHNDSLAVLFMVLALFAFSRGRSGLSGASLAVATAGKFLPAVLLPFLMRRSWVVVVPFVAVLVLLYLNFLAPFDGMFEGAKQYTARWRSNETLFYFVIAPLESLEQSGSLGTWEAQELAKVPIAFFGFVLLGLFWMWRWPVEKVAMGFFLYYVAFTPVLHPWYLAFLVPFLCVYPNPGWLVFTGTVFLAYHVLPGWLNEGVWEEQTWVRVVEYLPFYGGFVWLLLVFKQRGKKHQIGAQPDPA